MTPLIKAEFRKLLSIRSTYVLTVAVVALIALFSYLGTSASTYEEAVCASSGEVMYSMDYADKRLEKSSAEEICGGPVNVSVVTLRQLPQDKLVSHAQEAVSIVSVFAAVVVVLLMAHEFRYNTINYTLTLSNSRSKVLLSKIIVSASYVIVTTLLAIVVSVAVTQLAANIKDLILPVQNHNWPYVLARLTGYTLAYTLIFLGVAVLIRILVASVIAIFLLPTISNIGSLLLTPRNIEPTKILPFSALDRFGNVVVDVFGSQGNAGEFMVQTSSKQATVLQSGLIVAAWMLGLWIVAWLLFLRRDAN
jgi:ABC-type transport system involved in multi-copper enzyme maturation permease subunit